MGANPIWKIEKYINNTFKEIFQLKENIRIPGMEYVKVKINHINDRIEAEESKEEPSESKLENLSMKKEILEDELSEFEEK